MKKIIFAAMALTGMVAAAPAMAQDFTGPKVEARVGFDHLNIDAAKGHVNADGVTYGVAVGYDVQVLPHVITGVEVALDTSSADGSIKAVGAANAKRDIEASARLGYALGPVLVYGKLGYSNQMIGWNGKNIVAGGLRYGGGAEFALTKHLYVKGEYRTTKYDAATTSHQGLVAVGLRF
jgi:outer membrane immunogenic protein